MKKIILILLIFLFTLPSYSKLRITTLHFVDGGDILYSGQYGVNIFENFFMYYKPADTSSNLSMHYLPVVDLNIGFLDRAQLSLSYANGPSISVKTMLLREDDNKFFPDLSITARDIISSREGDLFAISDSTEAPIGLLTNNISICLSKTINPILGRIHVGLNTNSAIISEKYNYFFALEKYWFGGFYTTYEGFLRFSNLHHNISFNYKYKKKLMISLGLGNLSTWISSSGLTPTPEDTTAISGYLSPTLFFSFNYTGIFKKASGGMKGMYDEMRELKDEMNEYRRTSAILNRKLDNFENHMIEIDEDIALASGRVSKKDKKNYKQIIARNIKLITSLLDSGNVFDSEEMARYSKAIIEYKHLAIPMIGGIIRNPKTPIRLATACIEILGQIANRKTISILQNILNYPESGIKISAIIALGKIGNKKVVPQVERCLYDEDEAVAIAAQEVILKLTGKKRDIPKKTSKVDGEKSSNDIKSHKNPKNEDSKEASGDAKNTPKDNTTNQDLAPETRPSLNVK